MSATNGTSRIARTLVRNVDGGRRRCGGPSSGPAPQPPASQAPAAATQPASNPLKEAYFGEQHLHTAYSLDAYLGGTRLTPSDAYRFAKGAEVTVNGQNYRISKPLDWAAVTDHAEYLGEMYSTMVDGAPGHEHELLVELRGLTKIEDRQKWFQKYVIENNRGDVPKHPPFYAGPATTNGAWKVAVAAAEEHNAPGRFTAFAAFEWSGAPKGANLHRNVIFRDANVPDAPLSYVDANREDALWEWMAGLEQKGMKLLAIPHNSNASKGMMFAATDAKGDPINLEYAERRQHFEPLIEIMQIKGNSEVHRKFWGADEFADFENADSLAKFSGRTIEKQNFVRHAIIQGLAWEQKLGANPYKLGFVGGTDGHNGMPSDTEENDWNGAHGPEDGSVERRRVGGVGGWADGKDLNPGALTGVWATANTRGDIWDAMSRRETFATSGSRMKVRFFAGAGLASTVTTGKELVEQGYAKGVPMGATLTSTAGPLTFAAYAIKDPDGANLDRIQIVKGWVDADGTPHEKIVDVAWSGGRKAGKDGNPRGREHRRPDQGHLHQHHRQRRVDGELDGHRVRSETARAVLPARPRNPYAAVEHLRRGPRRSATARRCTGHSSGTRLELAHLVHAREMSGPRARQRSECSHGVRP